MVFWNDISSYPVIPPTSEESFDEVLDRSKLFKILEKEDRIALIKHATRKDLKRGEVLYRQGNIGESFYFLAEGLLCSSIEVLFIDPNFISVNPAIFSQVINSFKLGRYHTFLICEYL